MRAWPVAVAALAAALAPFAPGREAPSPPPVAWPETFDGRPLTPIAAAPEDAALARDFPGRVARFSDGRRQVVLRSVAAPTRRLHPARDCFRAIGYVVTPAPMRAMPGGPASCFEARRDGKALLVCERIADAAGASFADPSAWYWPALLGRSPGPWLAATVVEPIS